jgi:hypothetical protein
VDGTLAIRLACPGCGQSFDHRVDFGREPVRVIGCLRCQARFSVALDGTVTPLNRRLPAFGRRLELATKHPRKRADRRPRVLAPSPSRRRPAPSTAPRFRDRQRRRCNAASQRVRRRGRRSAPRRGDAVLGRTGAWCAGQRGLRRLVRQEASHLPPAKASRSHGATSAETGAC